MIMPYIFCLLQMIITLQGCDSTNNIYSSEEVPAIYFELGTAHYAKEFHYLENESTLPDSIYVYKVLQNIIDSRPLGSVTLLPFLDTSENPNLLQQRIAKVQEDFKNIGVDRTQMTVLYDHLRDNPVAEETIIALPSSTEQKIARSLNSQIGIILQPKLTH